MSAQDPYAPPPEGYGGVRRPAYGAYAPAGQVPPPGAPGADPWRPTPVVPTGLATWSIVLASTWTALQVLLFVTSRSAGREYASAMASGEDPVGVSTLYDDIGLLLLPVQVAAFVVSCLWLQRSREVATMLSPRVRQVRGVVWVWLGWLVPVVSFWFPYQVVRDVRSGAAGVRRTSGLGFWWAAWLVGLLATNQAAFSTLGLAGRDPASLPFFEGAATVATAVALAYWIRIVREITAEQRARPVAG